MEAIAIEHWEDLSHLQELAIESPVRSLKLINLGISEKIRILLNKNLGIEVYESALYMNDRDFLDIISALHKNYSIDDATKRNLISYKQLLNHRHNQYIESNIRKICKEGIFILGSL